MDLPTPNIPLLRKAVEWAEAEAAKPHSERLWNQGVYAATTACGTAYCIAGWTVATAIPEAELVSTSDYDNLLTLQIKGRTRDFETEAAKLLGLTDGEAYDLFAVDNSIQDVRRLAEQIAARAGERL